MALKEMYKRMNFFEKLLLLVGITITVFGFFFINKMFTGEGHLSWALLQAAFLWLLLIFLIILTDSNESIKEELKVVINEHVKETKLLKEIAQDQLKEIRLLRAQLPKKKR